MFELTDTLYGMAGLVRCDWRAGAPSFEIDEGDQQSPGARALLHKVSILLRAFHSGAYAGVSDADLAAHYAAAYHTTMNYANGATSEAAYKGALADLVVAVCRPRKVLVAGCSAGECIRQLRARGVDAWGFDICPDLLEIAYPEARPYVRRGAADAIPFGPEDGSDTLTALDVLEHVPEDRVPALARELRRLGIVHVAARVALCEFQYPGHITLRPLAWWDAQLGAAYTRRRFPSGSTPRVVPALQPQSDALQHFWQRVPTAG